MSEAYNSINRAVRRVMVFDYLYWHFIEMPEKLLKVWGNFIFFGLHIFSVPMLLQSLFAPYKKYNYFTARGFDFSDWAQTHIFNAFSRIIGFVLRFFLIFFGIILTLFMFIFGAVVFVAWYILPILALTMLYKGYEAL